MSTRTLLEINHDHLRHLIETPGLLVELIGELRSSMHNAAMNEANARGRALDLGHGVLMVHQYHHTTSVTVTTDYAEVRL